MTPQEQAAVIMAKYKSAGQPAGVERLTASISAYAILTAVDFVLPESPSNKEPRDQFLAIAIALLEPPTDA